MLCVFCSANTAGSINNAPIANASTEKAAIDSNFLKNTFQPGFEITIIAIKTIIVNIQVKNPI